MIEQWVIDQLDPLKTENLVILADPQRMIRAGARAVDGWAKEKPTATRGQKKARQSMPKTIHGKVHGKTIQLDEDLAAISHRITKHRMPFGT